VSATPNDVKRAVWTRLAGLVAGYTVTDATPTELGGVFAPAQEPTTPTRPFLSLHLFAGEVSRALSENRENGLPVTALGGTPSMLLAWEGSRPQGANGAFATSGPELVQVVARVHWRVFIAVGDPRGDGFAMDTALDAGHAVERALSEYALDGLFDGGAVRWVESLPWVTARRCSYVSVARFFADLELPAAPMPTPGTPFVLEGAAPVATPDSDGASLVVATFTLD
jgi:hypothetical protein